MKINFKTILIIFLVALLGSGLGTYGVLAFYKSDSKNSVLDQDTNVVINEVQYANMEKSDYTWPSIRRSIPLLRSNVRFRPRPLRTSSSSAGQQRALLPAQASSSLMTATS